MEDPNSLRLIYQKLNQAPKKTGLRTAEVMASSSTNGGSTPERPRFLPQEIDDATWNKAPPELKEAMMNLSHDNDKLLLTVERLKVDKNNQSVKIAAYKKLGDESTTKSVKLEELQNQKKVESLKQKESEEALKILEGERNDLKKKLAAAEKKVEEAGGKLLCFLRDAKKYIPDMPDFDDNHLTEELVDQCLNKVKEKLEEGAKTREKFTLTKYGIAQLLTSNWYDDIKTKSKGLSKDANGIPKNAGDPLGTEHDEAAARNASDALQDDKEVPDKMNSLNEGGNAGGSGTKEQIGGDHGTTKVSKASTSLPATEQGVQNRPKRGVCSAKYLEDPEEPDSKLKKPKCSFQKSSSSATTNSSLIDVQRSWRKIFICPVPSCGRSYESKGALKTHGLRHHSNTHPVRGRGRPPKQTGSSAAKAEIIGYATIPMATTTTRDTEQPEGGRFRNFKLGSYEMPIVL